MESKQQHIEEKEINKNEKQANDNQQLNMQHQDTGQSVRQQITGEQQHQIQQQSGPLEVQRHFQQPVLEQHHQQIEQQLLHAQQQRVDNAKQQLVGGKPVLQQTTGEQYRQMQPQHDLLEIQPQYKQPVIEQNHHEKIQQQLPFAQQVCGSLRNQVNVIIIILRH